MIENVIFAILIFVTWLSAGLSALVAERRNRSPAWWFGLGLIFTLWGLVAVALLPALAEEAKPTTVDDNVSPYAWQWAIVTYVLLAWIALTGTLVDFVL